MFIMVNVDDESTAIIRLVLAKYGDIYTVDDAQGALALMSKFEERDVKCRVLFTNMELSEGNGLYLLKEIRKCQALKDFVTKVVLISNKKQTAYVLNHLCHDTELFLSGPVTEHDIEDLMYVEVG